MQWSKELYLFTKIYPSEVLRNVHRIKPNSQLKKNLYIHHILSRKEQSGNKQNSTHNIPHLRYAKDTGAFQKTTRENVNTGYHLTV